MNLLLFTFHFVFETSKTHVWHFRHLSPATKYGKQIAPTACPRIFSKFDLFLFYIFVRLLQDIKTPFKASSRINRSLPPFNPRSHGSTISSGTGKSTHSGDIIACLYFLNHNPGYASLL
ncbi:hypothetical protein BDQ12DRAFT_155872 [Crucibulum laeve]|uniref:Uncharacterized protein n=1 Tax=Crucibulum laeve TaxID=68775 RepID=A0A5C3LWE0_9AGAR|nr:hypothetical protein BDQ12DRAFT_155872 [Crucibulum laeve]